MVKVKKKGKAKESEGVKRAKRRGLTKGGMVVKKVGEKGMPTDEDVKQMSEMRDKGIPERMICAVMGLSSARFQSWMERGEEDLNAEIDSTCSRLYVAMGRAEYRFVSECIAGMLDSARKDPRNWQAYAWLLERSFPDEYGMAKRADIGSKDTEVKVVVTKIAEKPAKLSGVVDVEAGVVHPPVPARGQGGEPVRVNALGEKVRLRKDEA